MIDHGLVVVGGWPDGRRILERSFQGNRDAKRNLAIDIINSWLKGSSSSSVAVVVRHGMTEAIHGVEQNRSTTIVGPVGGWLWMFYFENQRHHFSIRDRRVLHFNDKEFSRFNWMPSSMFVIRTKLLLLLLLHFACLVHQPARIQYSKKARSTTYTFIKLSG